MKKFYPSVTVVIPAHNEEKYLAQTLESALLVDYPNYNIVVANNASRDRTLEIAREFEKKYPDKITVVDEPRAGVSFAREAGRVAATGEVIAQLDADCVVPKNWIKNAVRFFANPQISAVGGTIDFADSEWKLRYGTLIVGYLMPLFNFLLNRIKKTAICWGANLFIRASSLEQIGGYRKGGEFYGEEHDTATRLLTVGKIKYSTSFRIKTSARRFNLSLNPWEIMKKYNRANASTLRKKIEIGEETVHPR